ncbi:MAG: hypothetical protein ABFS28_09510 [Bacteroidota bacterium]
MKLLISGLTLFLMVMFPFTIMAQVTAQSLTDTTRFKYHGYFFKNEAMADTAELQGIREFANMLVFSMVRIDSITPEMIELIMEGKMHKLDQALFNEMGRRIDLLESMDYITVAEAPFYPLIRFDRFEEYKKTLKILKKRVPQMDQLDYLYFWDEPDLNHKPGPEVMEKYITEFKKVFPSVKVTTCYAIINEESLNVVPPSNYDLLMIDPYMLMNEAREHAPADFERWYRSRLALGLEWVNKWNKPFLMVGDAFGSLSGKGGKQFPTRDVSLWYYITAMTQARCTGLLWFQYGFVQTNENIAGITLDGPPQDVLLLHREIGHTIFGSPSLLGFPMDIPEEPVIPEIIKEAQKRLEYGK